MPEDSAQRIAVVLFTRDLRTHDHPALQAACEHADVVIPLFVLDEAIVSGTFGAPNRLAFLHDALTDLRAGLRERGADLVVRSGNVVTETMNVVREAAAGAVVCSADVSAYATARERALRSACAQTRVAFRTYPGVTVVPAGEITPTSGDHYRVFTPYWRAWDARPWRALLDAPRSVPFDTDIAPGRLPSKSALAGGSTSPELPAGGETTGRRLLTAAVRRAANGEPELDDLVGDETSRLSPYLHFGCVSPLETALRLREDSPAQVRQLAWRDFHHQVTAAFPGIARQDYRDRGRTWKRDDDALDAWRRGLTGVPIVDAGMRQLLAEGWMHNRARLITASFLTKTLELDWRPGAAHFFQWLADGDIANNGGNWQWVAGTGNDTRPNRKLSPLRQASRFDPDGAYVRRYVPELAGVTGSAVHTPWTLPETDRRGLDYPEPLVEL